MPIVYREETGQFYLHTAHSTYIIELLDRRIPLHAYWGARLEEMPPLVSWKSSYFIAQNGLDTDVAGDFSSTGALPLELPTFGAGDLREPALHAAYADGSRLTRLEYLGHAITPGKQSLPGLPATFGSEEEVTTLELELLDKLKGLRVFLQYAVFTDLDVISRSVRIVNGGTEPVQLLKVASVSVDYYHWHPDVTYLTGQWTRERHERRQALGDSGWSIGSHSGSSGHHYAPFFALTAPETTETAGDAYGFSLVYSGNFEATAAPDPFSMVRAQMGLNSFDFNWRLNPGDEFQSPEAVMVYSSAGLGGMSRQFHRLIRKHLLRGEYRHSPRPVLLNTFEGVFFNFDEQKLMKMASRAKEIGIDMLVVDDGWFGKRDNDRSSLGDWVCNTDKLKDGLKGLGEKLHAMGLQFGLWFEPEMVSPDSDLYRAHPDWCIHILGRPRSESRHQLTLDLSRREVQEYIIHAVSAVLESAPIDYVKWDYNRYFSEIGSPTLPVNRQQELPHRYILGLYRVLDVLTTRFPRVLFESCASGGGRYDMGMLFYMPQTWCSDDTDGAERVKIQYGTSLLFPPDTMGAHVSSCPNLHVGRITPLTMRGNVAMCGQFGYELDVTVLSEDEIALAREQVAFYKQYREVIHTGDLYRLYDPQKAPFAAWEFVSPDGQTALLCTFVIAAIPNAAPERVKMQGLDSEARYREEATGKEYTGAFLMQVGVATERRQDYDSHILVFRRTDGDRSAVRSGHPHSPV